MSNTEESEGNHSEHLEQIDDGCGCVEMWEILSEQRTNTLTDD